LEKEWTPLKITKGRNYLKITLKTFVISLTIALN
jgi:hypothetical protein